MKTRIPPIALLVLLVASLSFAQPKQENKLVQFHVAILAKGPKWDGAIEPAKNPTLREHITYFVSLLDSGKAIIGGPLPDDRKFAGVYILRANSAEEAKA